MQCSSAAQRPKAIAAPKADAYEYRALQLGLPKYPTSRGLRELSPEVAVQIQKSRDVMRQVRELGFEIY